MFWVCEWVLRTNLMCELCEGYGRQKSDNSEPENDDDDMVVRTRGGGREVALQVSTGAFVGPSSRSPNCDDYCSRAWGEQWRYPLVCLQPPSSRLFEEDQEQRTFLCVLEGIIGEILSVSLVGFDSDMAENDGESITVTAENSCHFDDTNQKHIVDAAPSRNEHDNVNSYR